MRILCTVIVIFLYIFEIISKWKSYLKGQFTQDLLTSPYKEHQDHPAGSLQVSISLVSLEKRHKSSPGPREALTAGCSPHSSCPLLTLLGLSAEPHTRDLCSSFPAPWMLFPKRSHFLTFSESSLKILLPTPSILPTSCFTQEYSPPNIWFPVFPSKRKCQG